MARTALGLGFRESLAFLARTLLATSHAPRAGAGSRPVDPAAFLASLMDLRGSVELSQHLAALDGPLRAPLDPAAGGRARTRLRRLAQVSAVLERAFTDPERIRARLPTAAQMLEILGDSGVIQKRSGRPVASAADTLFAPLREHAARQIQRARGEVAEVRREIGLDLRVMGPSASRLERLDGALAAAAARGEARLLERLLPAAASSFARALGDAAKALPADVDAASLAPWLAPGGFIHAEIALLGRIASGFLDRDRERLEALVEAACEASR